MSSAVTQWARGEVTWAQIEGLTKVEAHRIAETACALAEGGNLEGARLLFEGLVEMNPRDAAVLAALGTVYQKLDRIDDAQASYEAALAIEGQQPVALANRGELRLLAGDDRGCEDLRRAVDADPTGITQAAQRAAAILKAWAMAEQAQRR